MTNRRTAIVHDFFGVYGGAERVATEIARIFPDAPIYTSVAEISVLPSDFPVDRLRVSPLGLLPGSARNYRLLLPVLPSYFSHLDLRQYDLVISSSVAFAKAVRTRRDARHISYCYTPNRYAWDLDTYLDTSGMPLWTQWGARGMRPWLRRWDRKMGQRPDVIVAISRAVQARIRCAYGRTSELIHPFIRLEDFQAGGSDGGYLLVVSRLLSYKRLDLAIKAANRLRLPLKVVGHGPAEKPLRSIAGPTVEFLGHVPDNMVRQLHAHSSLFLFPGVDDFGIAPLEAMASGKPVVAFAKGGVLDTILDGTTGLLFHEQTEDAVTNAVRSALAQKWDPLAIRRRAAEFDVARFRQQLLALVTRPSSADEAERHASLDS